MTDKREDDISESEDHISTGEEVEPPQHRKLAPGKHSSSQITLADLENYYDVPLTEVARRLSISITMLKKLCRKFGINRWPHRQIRSINNTIQALQEQYTAAQTDEDRARINDQIASFNRKRRLVCRSASCGLNAALRNAIFLARPGELDEEVLFEQGLLPNLQAAMTHKNKASGMQRSGLEGSTFHELETIPGGPAAKYRTTNRRERAGVLPTPYGVGPAMVMPMANAQPPYAASSSQYNQADRFDYRAGMPSTDPQFAARGMPGLQPTGPYNPATSAALQQHFMQQFSQFTRTPTPLDSFSAAVSSRPHSLPPPTMPLASQKLKSNAQLQPNFAFGNQNAQVSNQQLQNEQMLMQLQMMQNASSTFPPMQMYQNSPQYPQQSMPMGGSDSTTVMEQHVGSGLADSTSGMMENSAKHMYGYSTQFERAQQAMSNSMASPSPEQFSEASNQEYLRQGYRASETYVESLSYPHNISSGTFAPAQFQEYRQMAQQSPNQRPESIRDPSDYAIYNATI